MSILGSDSTECNARGGATEQMNDRMSKIILHVNAVAMVQSIQEKISVPVEGCIFRMICHEVFLKYTVIKTVIISFMG